MASFAAPKRLGASSQAPVRRAPAAGGAAAVRPAAARRHQQQQRLAGAFGARAPARTLLVARSGSDNPGADVTKDLSTAGGGGGGAFDFEDPETAREAIDLGLVLCKRGEWDRALSVFQRALSLPGTGVKRYRDKPRLISDGEKMAALYNTACCHARLGQPREGLLALSACLEAGYADFNQIAVDPDLELLRQDPRFGQLLQRFQPKAGGFLGLKLPW